MMQYKLNDCHLLIHDEQILKVILQSNFMLFTSQLITQKNILCGYVLYRLMSFFTCNDTKSIQIKNKLNAQSENDTEIS